MLAPTVLFQPLANVDQSCATFILLTRVAQEPPCKRNVPVCGKRHDANKGMRPRAIEMAKLFTTQELQTPNGQQEWICRGNEELSLCQTDL
jgi:hypothetical protein